VTVFEASNTELKEFYLCVSGATLSEMIAEQCARPPAAIAHWKTTDGVFFAAVESFPDEAAARAFLKEYRVTLQRTGWEILT